MSTEERIKEDFAQWVEAIPKPNEYNRMYGHHLTSFKAGALSERNKTIEQMEIILTRILSTNSNLPEVLKNLESLKV